MQTQAKDNVTVFHLHAVCQVPCEVKGQTEELYTYVSADGKRGIQWRFNAKRSWHTVVTRRQNVDDAQFNALVNAFIAAGLKQHEVEGGFDAVIKTLKIA